MAIPASGPISMSQFNTELGRTATTVNSRLVSGSRPVGVAESVPGTGSLFWLANASSSLSLVAPHSMSEWQGYSSTYSLTVYGSCQATLTSQTVGIYYQINAGAYSLLGSGFSNTTCSARGTITGLKKTDIVSIVVALTNSPSTNGATFDANDNTTTCAAGTVFCDNTNETFANPWTLSVSNFTSTSRNAAIRVQVVGGSVVACV